MNYRHKPTLKEVKSFVANFNKKNTYSGKNYSAALKLTNAFFTNKSYENIFIKVNFINGAFKTAIGDTAGYARNIYEKVGGIDAKLTSGDATLINEICQYESEKSKKKRRNYSFATKFCHCHYPRLFPINDKFVRKSLCEFNKYHHFTEFKKADLFDYNKFKSVLEDFREFIKGGELNNVTIDRFLWALGKQSEEKERNT